MRSLYLKIFVWFWLAMALVGAAFVITAISTQGEDRVARWRPFIGSGMALNGRAAVEIWEREGAPGLAALLERIERSTGVQSYLFDAQGNELSGRPTPPLARNLALQAIASRDTEMTYAEGRRWGARPVRGADDGYVLVAEMIPRRPPRPNRSFAPFWGMLDNPRETAIGLFVVFLTAGLVCYGLARYLTSPVQRLREATRRLAHGDLTVRVGEDVLRRRDELAELGADFDLMAARLETMVTTQRRLLTDISHELRSPLARLNVALGLARQREGDAAEALDRIERESERLNGLIGQVLTLARLEGGDGHGDRTRVDLKRVVEDVVADADFEARDRQRSVRVVEADPCTLLGSAELLRSAVENVVRNAVDYTDADTEVEVSLTLAPNGRGPRAVVRVRDHGPGVPVESLEQLFEPFYRVAESRDRGTGGTGLGLAISERAVRVHGGSVAARNAPDGGLIVEIELPIA